MRREPALSDRYRKDPEEERFLARLNEILAPFEEAGYREFEEMYPTLHIVGAPRSGTTLLTQLIASCLDMGSINNLIAAFWRAPVHGVRLSRKLGLGNLPSSYLSDFGRTSDIHEPHEFGYFWSSLLGYRDLREDRAGCSDSIDWSRVRLVLNNMTRAFQQPIVFKSFLLGWHMREMQAILPKTCFAWIQRDPVQNAVSLLKTRRKYARSADQWVGLKPLEYEQLKEVPPWEQVAAQVFYLHESFRRHMDEVGGKQVLVVSYRELCESPKTVLNLVQELLGETGSDVRLVAKPPAAFPESAGGDLDRDDYRRVRDAVEQFFLGSSGEDRKT